MQVINLFSVPVFVCELESQDRLQKHEVELLKSIELEKQYGEDGNYLSKESHVLEKYKLDRIRNICDRYVENYTKNIIGITDKFKMFASWLSMNTKGTRHESHSHRNTMISCVLYFDEFMSDQALAPINFGQDGLDQVFKTFKFQFDVNNRNQYNNKVLTIFPKTNTMIIFPGWIQHSTDEAQSTLKRYCLGTNYFFTGQSAQGYHRVKISIE